MSFSELIRLELKVAKKRLKFCLGDLVACKQDPKQKEMVISGILPTGSYQNHDADYVACKLSKRGKLIKECFKQIELIKIKDELTGNN